MARITIEDCLEVMDNAFDICALAGKRAKDLASGAEPLIDSKDKPTVIALREISSGKIGMDYFEISNKEKIESQLFGDGISEEEVVNELSQQLEDITPEDNITSASPSDNTDQTENSSETSESTDSVNDSAVTTDVIKPE